MVISEKNRVAARYRLIEEVGQGGMAIVYRAHDESLQREVAIKILHPHLSDDKESRARLEREAQAVAKLKHRNILEIFDYSGVEGDSAYIVTEFIHGRTLKQFLETGTSTFPEIAALIVAELGGALAHAHQSGIIHRDIKPENVMIRQDGVLKLMDFGIAQVIDLERMTVTGQLLGSPAYMAPELIEGRPLDVRTDVFGLGILLYQIATGNLPFAGKNPHEVLRKITEGRFPDPRLANRSIGEGLWKIMCRALAHDSDARYPSMGAFVADLEGHLAECGIADASTELASYFADPAAFQNDLPARMTPALMATAERYVATRAIPRAIECWNRILAYDSANAQVMAALQRMERRSRLRVYGGFAVAGGGLAALIALLARLLSSDSDVRQGHGTEAALARSREPGGAITTPKVASPFPSGQALAVGNTTTARPALQRPARPRPPLAGNTKTASSSQPSGAEQTPTVGTKPVVAPLSRTLILGPTPQNVDVFLDGERQFSYDTDHRTLAVPWTENHVIEFRSPAGCCFGERIEVGPDRPLPPDGIVARRLKWKPARLVVTTVPPDPGVRIMVRDTARAGGGSVVESGEETNIPFLPSDEGQKDVEVSAKTSGGIATQRVTVRAGETKSVAVDLQANQ